MSEFLAITCPHCGEALDVAFDPGEGDAQFITDCEVCCRPISIAVRARNGEVRDVTVTES